MSNFSKKYGTKYLNGEDLGPSPQIYTVEWVQEDIQVGEDTRDVVKFRELEKPLPLNITQGRELIDALGENPATYPGRQVGLFGQKLTSGAYRGKWTVRVTPAAQPPTAAMQAQPAPQPPSSGPMPQAMAIPTVQQQAAPLFKEDGMPNFRGASNNYTDETAY